MVTTESVRVTTAATMQTYSSLSTATACTPTIVNPAFSTLSANSVPSAIPNQPLQMGKYHKFTLPDFNTSEPEVWFLTAEHIFEANAVNTEAERFSYLLQSIPTADLIHVRDIMQSDSTTKYTISKKRLIGLHGETKDQKIQRLLGGLQISRYEKPSIILAKIQSVVSHGEDGDVIHGMWIRSLPEDIRRFCMASTGTLEEKAAMADRLFIPNQHNHVSAIGLTQQPITVIPQTSQTSSQQVSAVQSNDTNTSMMNTLFNMLQNLQIEVASIRAFKPHNGNRFRNNGYRSRSPYRFKNFSRSRSKSPSAQTGDNDIEDGKCWYHREFGNRARKCRVGCDKYTEFGSGN